MEDNSKVFKPSTRATAQVNDVEDNSKVFKSNITRIGSQEKNNLYDLLNVVPAKPVTVCRDDNECSDFAPKNDKYYIPKKRSRLKVKTVRDIRKAFEQDTYSYLNAEIEMQQNYLLRKIRDGSSNTEKTKIFAKKILEADHPLSRSSWQMINNINPNEHLNPRQYVLWKGKLIQICGSRGGKSKIIHNFDRNNSKSTKKINVVKTKQVKRKGLLQNSLAVKFKPGPLGRKKFLDDSHQKYHLGQIELVDVPRPALEVKPAYGVVLDTFVSNLLTTLRDENGLIPEKWAEFAVSVLGKIENNKVVQTNEDCGVTFDLKYNLNKKRILMRQDIEKVVTSDINSKSFNSKSVDDSVTDLEVRNIMRDVLNAVEISIMQDTMYCTDIDPLPICNEPSLNTVVNVKEKAKKKYSELDRLDVTVIKLPDLKSRNNLTCMNSFCRLGCICESLNQPFRLKQHCGNLDCMFGCKCEKSKYRDIELLENESSDLIPGLLNLGKAINSGLAKEEQKFHQTVILSGEKSILLKEQKRNRKIPKRYSGFDCGTTDSTKKKKILIIMEKKLNCGNIVPWCMVHNLYRCFCKGKFTESSFSLKSDVDYGVTTDVELSKITTTEDKTSQVIENSSQSNRRDGLRLRSHLKRKDSDKNDDIEILADLAEDVSVCARTSQYTGRKYSKEYYRKTNSKILEMEKNDVSMQKKMLKLLNKNEEDTTYCIDDDTTENPKTSLLEEPILSENTNSNVSDSAAPKKSPNLVNNSKLITWLENNYKIYKERLERGIVKKSLDVPRKGKMALHTWEFILNRYKERKNHFLVSKEKPYRIFLAVNESKSFFDGCINIDDIRFSELKNYPIIVRNLLTNVTDLKNNFCILSGWENCWELIGSVTKKCESNETQTNRLFDTENLISDESNSTDNTTEMVTNTETDFTHGHNNSAKLLPVSDMLERSKWFLMTIENDFTEIRFYNKGFYVKYDSIMQAIKLARMSMKTVRLSSQLCGENNSAPQFGIYATPNTSQLCVFVGPYEIQEPLGLETIKNPITKKGKKTRGVWVATNKVDNMQVINDPLSFMPAKIEQSEIIVSHASSNDPTAGTSTLVVTPNTEENSEEITSKNKKSPLKPNTIRQTNGFFNLTSCNAIKQLPMYQSSILLSQGKYSVLFKKDEAITPEATEGLSNVKITSVYSEKEMTNKDADNEDEKNSKKTEKSVGMLILKPDEINKKLLESQYQHISHPKSVNVLKSEDTDINVGASCSYSANANNEILCISDDDDNFDIDKRCKDIWIQTKNMKDLGWIVGMQDNTSKISVLLPGSKQYSDFYTENEAFIKIKQYLVDKKYISKDKHVEWEVVDSLDKVKGKPLSSLRKKIRLNALDSMEETSRLLEDETLLLWNEARGKETEIKSFLKAPDNIPNKMADELKNMISGFDTDSDIEDEEESTKD